MDKLLYYNILNINKRNTYDVQSAGTRLDFFTKINDTSNLDSSLNTTINTTINDISSNIFRINTFLSKIDTNIDKILGKLGVEIDLQTLKSFNEKIKTFIKEYNRIIFDKDLYQEIDDIKHIDFLNAPYVDVLYKTGENQEIKDQFDKFNLYLLSLFKFMFEIKTITFNKSKDKIKKNIDEQIEKITDTLKKIDEMTLEIERVKDKILKIINEDYEDKNIEIKDDVDQYDYTEMTDFETKPEDIKFDKLNELNNYILELLDKNKLDPKIEELKNKDIKQLFEDQNKDIISYDDLTVATLRGGVYDIYILDNETNKKIGKIDLMIDELNISIDKYKRTLEETQQLKIRLDYYLVFQIILYKNYKEKKM